MAVINASCTEIHIIKTTLEYFYFHLITDCFCSIINFKLLLKNKFTSACGSFIHDQHRYICYNCLEKIKTKPGDISFCLCLQKVKNYQLKFSFKFQCHVNLFLERNWHTWLLEELLFPNVWVIRSLFGIGTTFNHSCGKITST